jgi:hypothetical protein
LGTDIVIDKGNYFLKEILLYQPTISHLSSGEISTDSLSKYFHTIIVNLIGLDESDKAEKSDYYFISKVSM